MLSDIVLDIPADIVLDIPADVSAGVVPADVSADVVPADVSADDVVPDLPVAPAAVVLTTGRAHNIDGSVDESCARPSKEQIDAMIDDANRSHTVDDLSMLYEQFGMNYEPPSEDWTPPDPPGTYGSGDGGDIAGIHDELMIIRGDVAELTGVGCNVVELSDQINDMNTRIDTIHGMLLEVLTLLRH